jgi:hypothetical protein
MRNRKLAPSILTACCLALPSVAFSQESKLSSHDQSCLLEGTVSVGSNSADLGLKVFNITDHFNPRDFQTTWPARASAAFPTAWAESTA